MGCSQVYEDTQFLNLEEKDGGILLQRAHAGKAETKKGD